MRMAAIKIFKAWKCWKYKRLHRSIQKPTNLSLTFYKKMNIALSPYENAKLVDKRDFRTMIFLNRERNKVFWILYDLVMERYLMADASIPMAEV